MERKCVGHCQFSDERCELLELRMAYYPSGSDPVDRYQLMIVH
jgi:hypothetical protein